MANTRINLVVDGGTIAESGTYDELLAKGGLFAELVARQHLDAGESGPQNRG